MLRLKRTIIAIFIPLVASSTMIATGFSLWGFLNHEYTIDERIYSQSVDVKPYYDSLGAITYSWDDNLYHDLRIVFEEGNEQQVTSNEEGITFMPEIKINIKDVPLITNSEVAFYINTIFNSDPNCSFKYDYYMDPQGFTLQDDDTETIYKQIVLSEQQIQQSQTSEGLSFNITPIYHWNMGTKPLNEAEYGEFIKSCRECTCSISLTLNLSISNIGGNN